MSGNKLSPNFITKVGNVLKLMKKAQNEREIRQIDIDIADAVKLSEEYQANHASSTIEVNSTEKNNKVESVPCKISLPSDENYNSTSDLPLAPSSYEKISI